MNRFYDWQVRLEAFARARACMPFEWGRNDCALFAADCVEALTGETMLADLRGYDARGALRLMEERGGLRGLTTEALGEPIPPAFASVGDVVVIAVDKREALGICNGVTVLAPGPDGMVAVSMQLARAAWRVG